MAARAVLLVAIVTGGCNATGATQIPTVKLATPTPPTTASGSAVVISTPPSLRGTWTADVEGTTASSGVWTLEITAANLALQNPVGGDSFTLDPTSITDTSMVLPAAADCPDQSVVTPGMYSLALTGDALVITAVSDSCGDRRAVLVAGPWARKH
ncbi:MAG: hypothetical protein HY264_01505 [Chloroflexi bacterium]|nr:hypothetical protein [Chloroflexota bacterium]